MVATHHYPAPAEGAPASQGFSPHTDGTILTFLPQQGKPGYEICLPDGRWVPNVSPSPDYFLVQAGDSMRRWTNHRYQSALHRVVRHPSWAGKSRYAIGAFTGPRDDFVMRALPSCVDAENPERYAPISYPDYLAKYFEVPQPPELGLIKSLTPAQIRAAE